MRVIHPQKKSKNNNLKLERGSKCHELSEKSVQNLQKSSEKSPRSILNFVLRRFSLMCARIKEEFLDLYSRASGFWRRSSTSSIKLSFGKESLAKKTSTVFKAKVNSALKTDYDLNSISDFDYDIPKSKVFRKISFVSTFALLALTFAIVSPLYIKTNETEATTGTATQSTTTLTITNAVTTAAVDLSVTSANGTFASSSSDISFGVKTTNYTGYTVSLAPKSGSTDLTNSIENETTSSYDSFTTLSSSVSENDFGANTAAAGSSYNGLWGIKPSQYVSGNSTIDNSASNGTAVYLPASSITIDKTSASNATAKNYTVGIGARASYSQSAGTYSNTYVLTATGNAISYEITYDKNTTDTVANMPYADNNYKQAGEPSATTITLSSLVPERDGYNFKGWCSVLPTDNDTSNPSCSGTTYNPDGDGSNLTYGIDYTSSNFATIYAMWEKVETVWGYMQDVTVAQVNAMADGDTLLLEDKRDGQYYTTRKVGGMLWMTRNLAIGCNGSGSTYGSSMSAKTLTSSNSNVSSNWSTPTASLTAGNSYDEARMTCDATYGAWYNYAAASAGTITGSSNSTEASSSICPSGWRLFTSAERTTLINNIGDVNNFNPVLGGYYYSGSIQIASLLGFWWSSTANSTASRHYLYYDGSSLSTSSVDRNVGVYVRCIKNDFDGFMQDVTKAQVDSMSDGDQLTLADSRDGQKYTVAKLADGKLWMISNLNLAGGTVLSSDKSDVPSMNYYTLPNSSTSGFSSDTTAYVYNSNSTSCGNNSPCYSYYSWLAATAGGKDASGNAVASNGYNAAYSVCPKGWKLPTSTTSNASAQSNNNWKTGDWYAFAKAYGANLESNYYDGSATFYNNVNGGNAAGKSPVFLPLAGYYYNSSFAHGGSYGYCWSRTASSSTRAYYLNFGSSYVGSADSIDRRYGFSVRCVYTPPTVADATYMQDVTAEMVADTAEGATASLTDSRDNQIYTVRKVGGLLWMTRNLAIGCNGSGSAYGSSMSSKTLTSSNSNVSSNWSTPTTSLTSGNDYSAPRMTCSSTYGAWYNYAAASAGTITGSSNSTEASSSICPSGWRLFTSTERTTLRKNIGDVNNFNPVLGGYYNSGSVQDASSNGFWWSSTASSTTGRYGLRYDGSSLNTGYYSRLRGSYVRCVRP